MKLIRMLVVAFLALACVASVASAQTRTVASYMDCKTAAGSTTLLDDVALNATAATRTIACGTGKQFARLLVNVFYTYAAATTVTAQLSCALQGTTNYAVRQTRSCTSGTCTNYAMTDTKTTSAANQSYQLEFDVSGCNSVKVLIGGAGPGASDLVDVEATATY